MFESLFNKIKENKELKESGKQLSIIPPFPRLAEKFPGFERGKLIEITASTGVGKTKFTKFFCITSVYQFIKLNPNYKVKIWYFALEETKDDFWLSFISTMLYEKFKISLSVPQLRSLGHYTLSDDILKKVRECQEFVEELNEFVEVIDYIHNGFGIYKTVRSYFENKEIGEYTYESINEGKEKIITGYTHKTDVHYFVITDHVSLLYNESGMSEHQNLGHFSKEYCLKGFCKRFGCTTINVHQQTAETEKLEFYRGESIEQKLEPSLNGLANNKETARDDDLVLGLFSPARYKINNYRGYDISKLQQRYLCLIFLENLTKNIWKLNNIFVYLYL